MKGRQINFYLNDLDLEKVEKYLQNIGFQIISYPLKSEKIEKLATLKAQQGLPVSRYLLLENQSQIILTSPDILPVHLPLIEYKVSNVSSKKMVWGRFYYRNMRLEDQSWQAQNEVFLTKAEKLFRWFKRNFKRQAGEPFYNFYASAEVVKMAENMRFNGEKQCIEVL